MGMLFDKNSMTNTIHMFSHCQLFYKINDIKQSLLVRLRLIFWDKMSFWIVWDLIPLFDQKLFLDKRRIRLMLHQTKRCLNALHKMRLLIQVRNHFLWRHRQFLCISLLLRRIEILKTMRLRMLMMRCMSYINNCWNKSFLIIEYL